MPNYLFDDENYAASGADGGKPEVGIVRHDGLRA